MAGSFLKQKIFSVKAFSLLELISAASIAAVLSVVGIKSYQSQVNKAKVAEAQESLTYIYSAQQVFYNKWGSYNENLIVVGAIPSGVYNYDAGFTTKGHVGSAGTDFGDNYPAVSKGILGVEECSSFNGICTGDCFTGIQTAVSSYSASALGYFNSNSNCEVVGRKTVVSVKSSYPNAKAEISTFKAIAIEELRDEDVWSINEQQQLVHEKDGT